MLADEPGCAAVQVSPDTLYLIEGGGGQGGPFTAMCWGDGFITNRCARPDPSPSAGAASHAHRLMGLCCCLSASAAPLCLGLAAQQVPAHQPLS